MSRHPIPVDNIGTFFSVIALFAVGSALAVWGSAVAAMMLATMWQ